MTGKDHRQSSVEIWGGIECSVVRIKNRYYDQLKKSGYDLRPGDIELFTQLGIKTIRFPVIWEKVCKKPGVFDFSDIDKRVEKLEKYGIEAIAGLIHHGNGPGFTHLNDPDFPFLLADYAYRVASRYPFIKMYTPVNEPLTTARFSGLYGIWFPHTRDNTIFLKIFLNQIKGIILSMKAVREVIPDAGLVQTEDLGKVYSTDKLRYQAEFENIRRWLTYDFLTGRFHPGHELYRFFISQGMQEKDLSFFIENSCIPSICGFNHYVTGERFLDHRYSLYPRRYRGGNGIHTYADVEAVRIRHGGYSGFEVLLKEAWERYHLPLALTEVHLACTREEQMRWFFEAYSVARALRKESVDIRAVTAWAVLGSYDWDSLLVKERNHYETGVYSLAAKKPRKTALAELILNLQAEKKIKNDYITSVPGWWKREVRILFPQAEKEREVPVSDEKIRPVLLTGATGSLGKAIYKLCRLRAIPVVIPGHDELDITRVESVEKAVEKYHPFAMINAAGFSKIDGAELQSELCYLRNTTGASVLAKICCSSRIKLVTFSSDQVFNGKKKDPYLEEDATGPVNIYGKSKVLAEEFILKNCPDSLIIRSSYFFNPWNAGDFLLNVLLNSRTNIYLPDDLMITPTYVPTLVNTVLDLMMDDEKGIWHFCDGKEMILSDFVQMVLKNASADEKRVIPVPSEQLNFIARRPKYSALNSSHSVLIDELDRSVKSFISEIRKMSKEEIFENKEI